MSEVNEKMIEIAVSDRIGNVSGLITDPGSPSAVLVLGHGAGAPMRYPFMNALAKSLMAHGIACVRYNFPYIENKKGRPDPPAIAEATVGAAVTRATSMFGGIPVFGGGKSFGGRMTSQWASKHPEHGLDGIVFYGFPLHAPGKPSDERAAHLKDLTIPLLFLQGTRDALADIGLIRKLTGSLNNCSLTEYERGDHSFKVPGTDLIPKLAEDSAEWMKRQ